MSVESKHIKYFGPRGVRTPNPQDHGYRYSTEETNYDEADQVFARKSEKLYFEELYRPKPYELDMANNLIYIVRNRQRKEIEKSFSDSIPESVTIKNDIYVLERLDNQPVPDYMVPAITDAIVTEWYLPDFVAAAHSQFGRQSGITRFYTQWDSEESPHNPLLEQILLRSGKITEAQLDALKIKIARRKWITPLETNSQMVHYARLQEPLTRDIYHAFTAHLERSGAKEAAWVMRLVAGDEAFHASCFAKIALLYAEDGPQTAEKDLYTAMRFFYMPNDGVAEQKAAERARGYRPFGITNIGFAQTVYRYGIDFPYADPNKVLLIASTLGRVIRMEDQEIKELLALEKDELEEKIASSDTLKKSFEKAASIITLQRHDKGHIEAKPR